MAQSKTHTPEFGSSIAKAGFRNEQDVVNEFNNWKASEQAQQCLKIMGYHLDEITLVEAFLIREIIKQSESLEKGNPKSDMQIQVTIHLKNIPDPQNVSVKLVSSKSGFNQIDKRWVEKYIDLWNIPKSVVKTLKQFTGEIKPSSTKKDLSDRRRVFLNEMTKQKQAEIISFFEENKVMIVADILKGRGAFSAQWMLVVQNLEGEKSKWVFKSINEVINHYSKSEVKISPKGSLNIGRLTMQRKGGDGGRSTANMLQFKFNPLELVGK
jgi:hypothetical protein